MRLVKMLLVSVLCVGLGMVAMAQAPAAEKEKAPETPTISDINALKLQAIELRAENLRLQIESAQQAQAALSSEARALYQALTVKGFTLTKDAKTGQWVYVKAETAK